jgi:hypothetical protein
MKMTANRINTHTKRNCKHICNLHKTEEPYVNKNYTKSVGAFVIYHRTELNTPQTLGYSYKNKK